MTNAIVSTKNSDHYLWGSDPAIPCDGWHLVKSKQLSIIQERVPAGGSEERHFHQKSEQFFYVLEGIATIEVAGVIKQLEPMQGLHIPAMTAHQLTNNHGDDLVFIVTSTPPSHGDRCIG